MSGGHISNLIITVLRVFIKMLLKGGCSYRTALECAAYSIVGVASKMLATLLTGLEPLRRCN